MNKKSPKYNNNKKVHGFKKVFLKKNRIHRNYKKIKNDKK